VTSQSEVWCFGFIFLSLSYSRQGWIQWFNMQKVCKFPLFLLCLDIIGDKWSLPLWSMVLWQPNTSHIDSSIHSVMLSFLEVFFSVVCHWQPKFCVYAYWLFSFNCILFVLCSSQNLVRRCNYSVYSKAAAATAVLCKMHCKYCTGVTIRRSVDDVRFRCTEICIACLLGYFPATLIYFWMGLYVNDFVFDWC